MAAPVDVAKDLANGVLRDDNIRVQLNNLIAAVRGIAAKLDLDAGVTDVNYFSLWLDAAIATAPVKIV